MTKPATRRPTAIPLDELSLLEADYVPGTGAPATLSPEADPFAPQEAVAAEAVAATRTRGTRWLGLLALGVGGLVILALGLGIDSLVHGLFERSDWLGITGIVFTAFAVVALVAIATREMIGLLRIREINHIHRAALAAAEADDRAEARRVSRELITLYGNRPEMARSRAALTRHVNEIIDGRDLIGLAERELLLPLDEAARGMVLGSAKRVALVTAISPRALVDLLFVAAEILRLIRRLAILYGGRPGVLGFVRLTRAAIGHLAVTGGMAAGDSLVQQIVGHGIAARLSARLGEGVVNGLLTARVGIAAIEVCRPLPFLNGRPPRLADVMSELAKLGTKGKG